MVPFYIKAYSHSLSAIILSGVFFLSGISKILYWGDTTIAVRNLVFDKEMALVISVVIVVLELSLSVLLLRPKFWRLCGIISVSMLIAFTVVVFWGKSQGLITQCPCFGKLFGAKIGGALIVRNSILLLCGISLLTQKVFFQDSDSTIDSLFKSMTVANFSLLVINAVLFGKLVGTFF